MANNILGIDVDEIIKRVLLETFPGSNEKDMQSAKSSELKNLKPEQEKPKKVIDEEDEASKNKAKTSKKTEVKASEVVKLFNQMRSGKSLKTKEIRAQFQSYFDALNGSERLALYSFAKAVSDIISGGNSAEESAEEVGPEDFGIEVSSSPKKKNKKKEKPGSKKDNSTPIVVGE